MTYEQLERLQPKQFGSVYFDSSPRNARIYVDGQILVGPDTGEDLRTPTKVILYEGRHDFTYVLEGHEDVSGYMDIYVGTTVNIFRNMKPGKSEEGWGQPQPQIWLSQQTGTLNVYSYPDGANVFIDGKLSGKAPATISNIPAGERRITFKMPGMMDEEKVVDIHPGAWSSIDATMRPVLPSLQSQSYQSMSSTYEVKIMQTGNITITTNPSGAKIYVNDIMKGTTPVKLALGTGYQYVVLEKDGYHKDFNRIYIHPGAELELSRNLSRLPYSQYEAGQIEKYIRSYFMSDTIKSIQGPATGTVVITSHPAGATVEMDGKMVIDVDTKEILKTPLEMEVGMGQHNFVFRLAGYCNEFETVYILPGTGATYIAKTFYVC